MADTLQDASTMSQLITELRNQIRFLRTENGRALDKAHQKKELAERQLRDLQKEYDKLRAENARLRSHG